jgi:hypothetical protein
MYRLIHQTGDFMKKNYCKIQNIEISTNQIIQNCIRNRACFYDESCPLESEFRNKFNDSFDKVFRNKSTLKMSEI